MPNIAIPSLRVSDRLRRQFAGEPTGDCLLFPPRAQDCNVDQYRKQVAVPESQGPAGMGTATDFRNRHAREQKTMAEIGGSPPWRTFLAAKRSNLFPAAALALFITMLLAGCQTARTVDKPSPKQAMPNASFFEHCAFVSVDIQEGSRPEPLTEDQVPKEWKRMGFTAADVNAASDFAWNTALPNAVKVTEACRKRGLPLIFIHWGYTFEDGMDLDPDIRKAMLAEHGADYSKWSGYIGQPGAKVAKALGKGDYVLAKTAQDAFRSCSIDFVLRNLGIRNIVFVGGHTGACLGKTAKSAKRLGYTILCVKDATNNARESSREKDIHETGYDYILTTAEFLGLLR